MPNDLQGSDKQEQSSNQLSPIESYAIQRSLDSNSTEKVDCDRNRNFHQNIEVAMLFIGLVLIGAAGLAVRIDVQKTPYGVLILAAVLGFLAYLFHKWVAHLSNRLIDFHLVQIAKMKGFSVIGVALLPIMFSAIYNGSLEASLNPKGYWMEQAALIPNCQFEQEMVTRQADEFRVAQNKYNMGIATVSEIQLVAETMKILGGVLAECKAKQSERSREVQTHIDQLR